MRLRVYACQGVLHALGWNPSLADGSAQDAAQRWYAILCGQLVAVQENAEWTRDRPLLLTRTNGGDVLAEALDVAGESHGLVALVLNPLDDVVNPLVRVEQVLRRCHFVHTKAALGTYGKVGVARSSR